MLVVKNGNFTFLQLLDQLALSSGGPSQFYISTIKVHTGRSSRCTPLVESSHGEFYISTIELILANQLADLPPIQVESSSVKSVNFTFLLLELILADQLADLPPPVQSSRGEAWQF